MPWCFAGPSMLPLAEGTLPDTNHSPTSAVTYALDRMYPSTPLPSVVPVTHPTQPPKRSLDLTTAPPLDTELAAPTKAAVAPPHRSDGPQVDPCERPGHSERSPGGTPLPSLDPDESNQRNGSQADIEFRHSWWRTDRRRIASALQAVFPSSKRLDRFRTCGDAAWVYRSVADPQKVKVCSDTCRDRWCRACQRDRSRIIAANLRDRLAGTSVKLVTLTLRHRFQPLRHQVDRLIDSFRILRKKPLWADSITGGVAFVEVTYNPETNRWHPHLHVLCVGAWISQSSLSSAWDQITGGSFVVDIRAVKDVDTVAAYVVKYATKPMNAVLYRHPAKLIEAMRALQGRHLCMTFGTFRGWKLTHSADDGEWVMLGTLEGIQQRAADGDWDAAALLDALTPEKRADSFRAKPP